MTTIVTGWSPAGYEQYGRRFVSSFCKFWPDEYQLVVYVEEYFEHVPRIEQLKLEVIPGCCEFIEKYRNDERANGRAIQPDWKDKCKREKYNFKFDAWKFCRQGFIPYDAAQRLERGLLCWLDGDVVTHARIPHGFIEGLLPEGKHIAYLGRPPKHSEIGFQLYRIPEALPMLFDFCEFYNIETVFGLKEWHSAYVFDTARSMNNVPSHNLTPRGMGHVWHQSPLAKYMDHLKGARK